MIHFDWSISLGQIVTGFLLVAGFLRIDRRIRLILLEHELLIDDYCKRNGLRVHELVTRRKAAGA